MTINWVHPGFGDLRLVFASFDLVRATSVRLQFVQPKFDLAFYGVFQSYGCFDWFVDAINVRLLRAWARYLWKSFVYGLALFVCFCGFRDPGWLRLFDVVSS